MSACRRRREGDELTCPACHKRWDAREPPDCWYAEDLRADRDRHAALHDKYGSWAAECEVEIAALNIPPKQD